MTKTSTHHHGATRHSCLGSLLTRQDKQSIRNSETTPLGSVSGGGGAADTQKRTDCDKDASSGRETTVRLKGNKPGSKAWWRTVWAATP